MSRPHRSGLPLPVVDFLDTSVIVEVLDVPHRNARHAEVVAEMKTRVAAGVQLVLPTATIVETGNHVFQVKDGAARRTCATRFQSMLRKTARGAAPWVLHQRTWDDAFLTSLCDGGTTGMDLVEHAVRRQLGTGNLSIVAERDLYACRVQATVRVWTLEATMGTWAELP
ncbi:hypothetical protein FH609_026085 [Streptomyces sp. 3MP-14]|uniref:PIN domain-containing protein n=1 Tax=Streptomyces mimosae TaxID=2586635 RepID=A0A5N5ZYR4_9ACTN|nr:MULTISPECIES: hypothetical protein [Streptomyces]KAB8161611.1 hypothetical protein FH607_024865 [Streptomyces mimosae]KAB8173452.1 hypothetical protein FH609_026085 [Streptomyces sp. 3MP-14]